MSQIEESDCTIDHRCPFVPFRTQASLSTRRFWCVIDLFPAMRRSLEQLIAENLSCEAIVKVKGKSKKANFPFTFLLFLRCRVAGASWGDARAQSAL